MLFQTRHDCGNEDLEFYFFMDVNVIRTEKNKFSFLSVLFIWLSITTMAFGGPITSLIVDLEGTLIQKQQDYVFENGHKIPLLKQISGQWIDASGKNQSYSYYIKKDAIDLLKYALTLQKEGHIPSGIHVLTFMPQAKLNSILKNMVVDGKPLIDTVSSAFGTEAITAYSRSVRPDETGRGKKDLGLFTREKNLSVWTALKKGDLSQLSELKPGKVSGAMTSVMLDDKPGEVINLQKDNVVQISELLRRDEDFWRKYKFFKEFPMDTPQSALEAQNFLALLQADRDQLKTFRLLLEDTKRTTMPNPYNEWTSLLSAQRTLGLDFAQFNFLLADLALKDRTNLDILVLGRDSDLFWSALDEMKTALKMKARTYYLEISRLVAQNEASRLPLILSVAGIDVDAILSGKRSLLIVDSNYNGSIPKAILKSLVPENDSNWKKHVKNIRTWMFNPARVSTRPPEAFSSYNEYLINGAFIDPSVQQLRVGHDYMRMVTAYQDMNRPKKNIRSIEADADGKLITRNSHPSELRYSDILHDGIRNYYSDKNNQDLVLKRVAFLKGVPGEYPRLWALSEPTTSEDTPIIKEADLNLVKNAAKSHHRFLLKSAETFDNKGKKPPVFIPHHRLPRQEKQVEWHMYAPDFAKGEKLDLSQNFLKLEPISPIYDMSSWPKLDLSKYHQIRLDSVSKMSRTANGINGNSGKKLTKSGDEMASATKGANQIVGENLLAVRTRNFETASELADFIIDKINVPYVKEVKVIESRADIWRTWAFQNEEHKASKNFFARHSPLAIEKDWLWFTEWLNKNLQQNYDPIDLSARVHYYLSNWIHPFTDGVGKTTRDIIDLIFIKKGLAPIEWSRVDFDTYWVASGSIKGIQDILLSNLDQYDRKKITEKASVAVPALQTLARGNLISCQKFYGSTKQ